MSFSINLATRLKYLRDQKWGASIDGDGLIEAVRGDVHEIFEDADPGVVDQDVYATACPFNGLADIEARAPKHRAKSAIKHSSTEAQPGRARD